MRDGEFALRIEPPGDDLLTSNTLEELYEEFVFDDADFDSRVEVVERRGKSERTIIDGAGADEVERKIAEKIGKIA